MSLNVGIWDRNLRIGIGVALLSLVVVGPQTPWGLLGLLPLLTGLARFCPAYRITGVDTCLAPHDGRVPSYVPNSAYGTGDRSND